MPSGLRASGQSRVLEFQPEEESDLLFCQIERCSARLGADQHAARCHVCRASKGCARDRSVKRNFYRTHWELVLAGKGYCVLRDDARRDWDLDTSALRMRKDKSPGDGVAILIQRQLCRSLPLVFSSCTARLNCSLPHPGNVVAQHATRK